MGAKKTHKAHGARHKRGASLKDLCRSLPATTEDIKWGDDHVFSVGGKMYAAFDVEDESRYGFKCDDDDFDELTEREGIIPAPYAARFGWVSVREPGALKRAEAERLIRKSHALVASKLTKKLRRELGLPVE